MLAHHFSHYYYNQKCRRMVQVVANVISSMWGGDEVLGVEFHSICKLGADANSYFFPPLSMPVSVQIVNALLSQKNLDIGTNASLFFMILFGLFVAVAFALLSLWCCSLFNIQFLWFLPCRWRTRKICWLSCTYIGWHQFKLWSNWSPHIVVFSKWKLATLHMILSVTISNCLAQY
jgi:hypothetical protein